MKKQERQPSILLSFTPFVILIALVVFVIRYFGADALGGASQLALLLSTGVVVVIAMTVCHVPWNKIEESIAANLKSVGPAIIILLLIGAIGGTWMVSGIVPTLIVYGLKVISPGIYLFAACIICALISVMTGSSWTTIATLGVALIAIGKALGFSEAWCAGAIISGAYFGDKISPMSDTTVLASSMSGVKLFDHIRNLLVTTVPAITISLIIYLIVSLNHASNGVANIEEVDTVLRSTFNISPWLLVVPLIVGIMIWRKVPAIILLMGASVMAAIAALIAQPDLVVSVSGVDGGLTFESGFRGVIVMMADSTSIATGSASIDALVSTSGVMGMMATVLLIVCASTFGGAMVGSGMIQAITDGLTRHIKSRVGLVGATLATGVFSNLVLSDQYLAIIFTNRLYQNLYRKMRYEPRLLSRSVEDSATITSVLIPWNSCGMTQSTVLRVPTLTYMPFCFFNILSPMMSLIVAALGYKIYRVPEEETVAEE